MTHPQKIVIGRRVEHKLDVFRDFLEAFSFCAYCRFTDYESGNETRFYNSNFGSFSYKKTSDIEFNDHVSESVQLAWNYLQAKRLYGFEVCMVSPSNAQLLAFRIAMKQMDRVPDCEKPTERTLIIRLTAILEQILNFNVSSPILEMNLKSSKFRPRIRLLVRLRNESKRLPDHSTSDGHETIPLGDSLPIFSNFVSFYAHL